MRYFGILCAVKEQYIATTFTSSGTTYFNDMLGTTLGARQRGPGGVCPPPLLSMYLMSSHGILKCHMEGLINMDTPGLARF